MGKSILTEKTATPKLEVDTLCRVFLEHRVECTVCEVREVIKEET